MAWRVYMVNDTTGSFICLQLYTVDCMGMGMGGKGNGPHGNPMGMGMKCTWEWEWEQKGMLKAIRAYL